ncbi:MAG: hypothetical protein Q8L69_07480 [Gallionellaceae bacterium]|nr:hypothetical protein [Gallionellaceae bacterium]
MILTPDLEAQILRYYHVEKWRNGTIARQLHVHHSSVEGVLRQAGLPRIGTVRPSGIDPYLPFIHQTLEKFTKLTSMRSPLEASNPNTHRQVAGRKPCSGAKWLVASSSSLSSASV